MDINTLKNFIVLAESESVSQAARKLYMAQSALSNRLRALEKECGALLIERDYHNFRLTESGRILYERALKIVELTDAAVNDVHVADTGEGGTLNIAVTPSLATGILRDILRRYRSQHPAVTVRIYEGSTPSVLDRMEDGSCDIALVRTPYTRNQTYETMVVDDDRMRLREGEKIEHGSIRFRTLGCYPLTGGIESTANTLDAIIDETLSAVSSERTSRVIDSDGGAASMEKRKREGYF